MDLIALEDLKKSKKNKKFNESKMKKLIKSPQRKCNIPNNRANYLKKANT